MLNWWCITWPVGFKRSMMRWQCRHECRCVHIPRRFGLIFKALGHFDPALPRKGREPMTRRRDVGCHKNTIPSSNAAKTLKLAAVSFHNCSASNITSGSNEGHITVNVNSVKYVCDITICWTAERIFWRQTFLVSLWYVTDGRLMIRHWWQAYDTSLMADLWYVTDGRFMIRHWWQTYDTSLMTDLWYVTDGRHMIRQWWQTYTSPTRLDTPLMTDLWYVTDDRLMTRHWWQTYDTSLMTYLWYATDRHDTPLMTDMIRHWWQTLFVFIPCQKNVFENRKANVKTTDSAASSRGHGKNTKHVSSFDVRWWQHTIVRALARSLVRLRRRMQCK